MPLTILPRKSKQRIKYNNSIQSSRRLSRCMLPHVCMALDFHWVGAMAIPAYSEPANPWNTDGRGDRDWGDSIPASGERREPNVGLTGLGEYIDAKSEKL